MSAFDLGQLVGQALVIGLIAFAIYKMVKK